MIGLSSSGLLYATSWNGGQISIAGPSVTANSWTHAGVTYRSTNGHRLYANGGLWNSEGPNLYASSGVANYPFVGNPLGGTYCAGANLGNGHYSGVLDEFRLYSRELTAAQIFTLPNP